MRKRKIKDYKDRDNIEELKNVVEEIVEEIEKVADIAVIIRKNYLWKLEEMLNEYNREQAALDE